MSDIQTVEGDQDSGFASEWQALARKDEGQATTASPESDDRHERALEEKPNGQAEAPQDEGASGLPSGENTDDIWANAPEPLRQAFLGERAAREKAENAVRSNNGRVSKAERDAAELRARLAAPAQGQAPSPKEEAPKTDRIERLKAAAEEYGEVAGPVTEEVLELRETVERLVASNATAEEQRAARDQLELGEFLAGQERTLEEIHPDWLETAKTEEFVTWVQSGPQFIRDGIARNGNGIVDGAEAAQILTLFKERDGTTGAADPLAFKRARQLEGGRSVPARGPGSTTARTPDDFSAAWEALRQKDEQQGRQRQRTT